MPRTKKTETKPKYIFAVGRRRDAVARVRLFVGKGETLVNGKPIEQYFPGQMAKATYLAPFLATETPGKYFATVKIEGGGKVGQLGAFVHGLSRTLVLADREKFRKPLKEKGFLTRDSRTRERRKVGMGGKSRRKRQSPKR